MQNIMKYYVMPKKVFFFFFNSKSKLKNIKYQKEITLFIFTTDIGTSLVTVKKIMKLEGFFSSNI